MPNAWPRSSPCRGRRTEARSRRPAPAPTGAQKAARQPVRASVRIFCFRADAGRKGEDPGDRGIFARARFSDPSWRLGRLRNLGHAALPGPCPGPQGGFGMTRNRHPAASVAREPASRASRPRPAETCRVRRQDSLAPDRKRESRKEIPGWPVASRTLVGGSGAGGGTRTHTSFGQGFLRPSRLPFRHARGEPATDMAQR